jgi:hypothetical protein
MSISEMSDEDRAELFLVLGDVRGEIKDLRDASKTLRRVVVPRDEHDARRRFTLALFFVGILLAMNIHDIHIQHCMGPAHLRPGSAMNYVCDASFPLDAHASFMHGPMPDPTWAHYPSPGNILGLIGYALVFGYASWAAVKVYRMNRRVWE